MRALLNNVWSLVATHTRQLQLQTASMTRKQVQERAPADESNALRRPAAKPARGC